MELLDYKPDLPGGGRAPGGGGFYHLSFRSGSRGGGASARSACDYVMREDTYADPDRDPAIYTESGHMPCWADGDPAAFWDAADLYERENGRLYVSADFALPRELNAEDQIQLARDFAHDLIDDERLPYTLAVHAGCDRDGQSHNPHAHLMFSERRNDGIERSREQWFRRANSRDPARGGAPKSRGFHGRQWVDRAREQWAKLTNDSLERAGRTERVDHRSYERQGIEREPGSHYGPDAPHVAGRGDHHDRLEVAAQTAEEPIVLQRLDAEIARLESARERLLGDGLPKDREPESRDYSHSSFGAGGSDRSVER
jgi:MobA/MobL family